MLKVGVMVGLPRVVEVVSRVTCLLEAEVRVWQTVTVRTAVESVRLLARRSVKFVIRLGALTVRRTWKVLRVLPLPSSLGWPLVRLSCLSTPTVPVASNVVGFVICSLMAWSLSGLSVATAMNVPLMRVGLRL